MRITIRIVIALNLVGAFLTTGAAYVYAANSNTTSTPSDEKVTKFDYDTEIQKAQKSGDALRANLLRQCQKTPKGATVTLAPSFAALMRSYCKERDFEIVTDKKHLIPESAVKKPQPSTPKDKKEPTAEDKKIMACRKETMKYIIACAKVTDYQNCEPWGCPEIVECEKRLTRCDDYGSPYNSSDTFYCDTRNWRTRDFSIESVLQRTCSPQK